jgi:hypothetical protein
MERLFEFEVAYGETRYRVDLSAEEPVLSATELSLVWSIQSGSASLPVPTEVKARVDLNDRSLTIQGLVGLTSFEACLAACGVAGIVGPLVECFDRNPRKYLDCLKSKGRSVSADVIKCAIGCVGGALVPGAPA